MARNPPESLKSDTSHTSRQHLSACTDAGEKHQQINTFEDVEQDPDAQHLMINTYEETTPTQPEGLHTLPTSADKVITPTEKVGCILVTSQ